MKWTREADDCLLKIINQHKSSGAKGLPWPKIHVEFGKTYPDTTKYQVENRWRFHLKDADMNFTEDQASFRSTKT